ncbi:MAG: ABC transporter permease [Clostridia bacterium]|nr:ABC transporter permease [Clostridia bacterium]
MRSFQMAKRIVKQLLHYRRTLALLFIAPLFVLFILYNVLGSSIGKPRVETSGLPAALSDALAKETDAGAAKSLSAAMKDLKDRKTDAVITYDNDQITVSVEGSEPSVTAAVKKAVATAVSSYTRTHAEETAQQQIAQQKQTIEQKLRQQLKAFQSSLQLQMQQRQNEAQQQLRLQIGRQLTTMQASAAQAVEAQMKQAVQEQLQQALKDTEAQQQQAAEQQLTAWQKATQQSVAMQLKNYSMTVRQAATAYLQQNGVGGKIPAFQMPAFEMPSVNPPKITAPAVQLPSIALPDVKLPAMQAPAIQMPSVTLSDTTLPAIDLPETSISFSMPDITYAYVNGSDTMTTFDAIAGMMMGFFIFFFVFLIAGVSFLRERISGTLERLLATPIRRIEIVMGYFLGFGVFVLVQTVLIQLFMVYALHISLKGSFMLVLLTNVLLASSSLALGTLLSAFARNELQLFQFIPIVIVPQVLFCGIFNLRGAPLWVVALSKIFPLTYGADALTGVAIRGAGLAGISADLLVLAGFTVLFLLLNARALRKYRRF